MSWQYVVPSAEAKRESYGLKRDERDRMLRALSAELRDELRHLENGTPPGPAAGR